VCSQGQGWNVGGNCTGTATTQTWDIALQIPQTLNTAGGYAGFSDWRLPNIKELKSLAELKCYSPTINGTIFPATPGAGYWSSSPYASGSDRAWLVYSVRGYDGAYGRYGNGHVRLVRGGQ